MSRLGVRRLAGTWFLSISLICLLFAIPAMAQYQPDPAAPRSDVPEDHRWKSSHIFPNKEAWEQELTKLGNDIPSLTQLKGHLGESAVNMLEAQDQTFNMLDRLYKVYVYSQTLYDVDQIVTEHREMQGRVSALLPAFGEATSWMEPELLEIDPEVIKGFMRENKELAEYDYYFSELWRQKDNTLSGPEERLMALTGNVTSVAGDAHEALLGVDMKFPDIVDGEGNTVPLTVSGFSGLRSDEVYSVRKQAATAFFGTLRKYENTFSVLLDGAVKGHIMSKDARGYESCLEGSLSPDNISTDAYRMLINTVRENLPKTMHKYVSLRRKVMGLDGPLTFPNLYNAMIEGVEPEYTYADAQELIVKALKPLGKEYCKLLKEGLDPASGWIDVYPNANKRSGAYSNGILSKSVHPFVLHNFNNSLDSVSTTAHEMGHALHSVYSNATQLDVYSDYTTFLAEIASTCNEALLVNYLLEQNKKDTDMTLLLLNQRLESIRQTIFRQTMFADFELRFHEHAENGNSLTAGFLNDLYAEMVKDYYGPEFELGPDDACEWMFIPHFYYNFYVFSYATGLTSGLALASEIGEHGDEAAERYVENMLKAGSSAPPLDILRNAGVDLETPAPIVSAMKMFEETVEEFDKVWTKEYGKK